MPSVSNLSVIIPTYQRVELLRQTLNMLSDCDPAPAEILVHVDAGDQETSEMLASEFPQTIILQSDQQQGPGGGRNKLVQAASHECLVSLDDDSWPLTQDFFQHTEQLLQSHDDVAVIACAILESDGSTQEFPSPSGQVNSEITLQPASHFVGCGVILRRSAFLQTRGYVPLRQAYGMEETDMTLQLLDADWEIRSAPALQIFHACDRISHHANPAINAAHIRNLALLVFLRYPLRYFPFGTMQVINRVGFSLRHGRYRGVLSGLCSILPACWKYRRSRAKVSVAAIRKFRALRKQEVNNH